MTRTAFAEATSRKWDQLDTDGKKRAINALKNDLSREKMGRALGTTRNAIIGFAARQNIPLRDYVPRRPRFVAPDKPAFPVQPPLPESTWAPLAGSTPTADPTRNQCRWPVGPDADRTCCGLPKVKGSYCAVHSAKATRPTAMMEVTTLPVRLRSNESRISRNDVRNLVRPAHRKMDGVE